jgi:peptidoglycan/LPS O-acetylase OafA/YrhL
LTTAHQDQAPRAEAHAGSAAAKGSGNARKGFRPEVQGLRSLAVLMVVVYHVWLGRVSGGVDIFLLISAFLLTTQFVRRGERNEPLGLVRHWLHLFKRLLPMVVVVILAVLAATFLLVPPTRWEGLIVEAWASLLYMENWVLAGNAVDYYATDDSLSSPFQHFWSLSIQGQVFILWPLIFLGAAWTARRYRLKYKALLTYVFGLIFAASLAFSVSETASNQAFAYFDTRARLWEFALGSLLALALPYLKPSIAVRVVLGWLGVAAMLSCGIILQVQQQFPGYVALWPTLSAVAIIVAGNTGHPLAVDRILTWKPLVYLGNNSYGLYLWHWPLLICYLIWADKGRAGWLSGTAIILGAIILAIVTTRLVETPIRNWQWASTSRLRAGTIIAVCIALVAAPLLLWQHQMTATAARAAEQTGNDNPGAVVLLPGYNGEIPKDALIRPDLASIKADWPHLAPCTDEVAAVPESLEPLCSQQPAEGKARKTVVVVGNSHAHHMASAVVTLAKKNNWNVINLVSLGCPFGPSDNGDDECNRFYEDASDYILQSKPDAVFTIATRTSPGSPEETLPPAFAETVARYTEAGIEVVGIRDNPRFDYNMPECASENLDDVDICAWQKDAVVAPVSPLEGFAAGNPRFSPIDMTDLLCPGTTCPAVIGNVYVYIDNNHVSKTYWESMVPEFERRLAAGTGWN